MMTATRRVNTANIAKGQEAGRHLKGVSPVSYCAYLEFN